MMNQQMKNEIRKSTVDFFRRLMLPPIDAAIADLVDESEFSIQRGLVALGALNPTAADKVEQIRSLVADVVATVPVGKTTFGSL